MKVKADDMTWVSKTQQSNANTRNNKVAPAVTEIKDGNPQTPKQTSSKSKDGDTPATKQTSANNKDGL
ncbi:hypothetical protein FSP39_002825 [Pinctada imbricata]|uniref:Uncharacterized protein n=1 Tax=Pinctada imbricata TaxID=66713 RepID=A0AA88XPJ2_PINIB|nr:hypothetical protein FSP39_002825 [Pinctada imbricata]